MRKRYKIQYSSNYCENKIDLNYIEKVKLYKDNPIIRHACPNLLFRNMIIKQMTFLAICVFIPKSVLSTTGFGISYPCQLNVGHFV